jgi:hypothetical protein
VHIPCKARWLRRAAVVAAVPMMIISLMAGPASAVDLTGIFTVSINPVTANGSAFGTLSDGLNPGTSYITALTATGSGTCSLTGTEVVIDGVSTASGNPAYTHTLGACDLYNATVEYTLTWTSILGTTGQFQRTCVWVIGIQVCTPPSVSGHL